MTNEEQLFLGQAGTDLITTTDECTPPASQAWVALQLNAETVFERLVCPTLRIDGAVKTEGEAATGAFTNLTLAAGIYYGQFTSVKRSSGGSVVAYCGRKG